MTLPARAAEQQTPQKHPDLLSERERTALWGKLTDLQRAWVQEYLTNGYNQAQAARDAGYKCSTAAGFAQQGHENRNKPKIAALVEDAFAQRISGAELETYLEDLAQASMADFLRVDEGGSMHLDFAKAQRRGVLDAIKSVDVNARGEVTNVELYSRKQASTDVLKKRGEWEGSGADAEPDTQVDVFADINEALILADDPDSSQETR